MQVWIVQHGKKIATAGDPGLTDAGHAQAALVARTLAGSGADVSHSPATASQKSVQRRSCYCVRRARVRRSACRCPTGPLSDS